MALMTSLCYPIRPAVKTNQPLSNNSEGLQVPNFRDVELPGIEPESKQ